VSNLACFLERFGVNEPAMADPESPAFTRYAVSGCLLMLLILLAALVMAVGNICPWEDSTCGSP
jgi:hypothetical protein